jgi:hypothetical protein
MGIVLCQCPELLRHQCLISAALSLGAPFSGVAGEFLPGQRHVIFIAGLTGNGHWAAPLSL